MLWVLAGTVLITDKAKLAIFVRFHNERLDVTERLEEFLDLFFLHKWRDVFIIEIVHRLNCLASLCTGLHLKFDNVVVILVVFDAGCDSLIVLIADEGETLFTVVRVQSNFGALDFAILIKLFMNVLIREFLDVLVLRPLIVDILV